MNELKLFNYNGIQGVRVMDGKEPMFVARDVCDILELGDVSKAVSRLPETMKGANSILTLGGIQEMLTVTEAGMYKLVFTSRKKEAEKFTDWLATEVIPSIRKHGMYATEELLDNPDLAIKAFTALKEEREKNKLLQTENKLLAQENLTWANRKIIEAVIKKYGAKIGYENAWREFKKELLYKHSINLNSRITNYLNDTGKKTKPKTLDMIHDSELSSCISTAVALCRQNRIDISEIIKKLDKTA
jgi:prophage antirepressor-like protein